MLRWLLLSTESQVTLPLLLGSVIDHLNRKELAPHLMLGVIHLRLAHIGVQRLYV